MPQDEIDVMSLAIQAKQMGYGDIDRVVARLRAIIARNEDYLAYRTRKRLHSPYNETVREDSLVLAAAIVLLESTQK